MQSKVVRTLALALLLVGIGLVMGQTPQYTQSVQGQEKAKAPPKRKVIAVEEDETPKTTAKKKRVEEEEESAKSTRPKTPPKKSKLEEMLAEALQNHPDIRVAAAKLAEADAELNRTRLQVTQKIVMLYHAIQTQKKLVELEETKYKRYQDLLKGRAIDAKLADEKQQELALAKAKLAELEAQVPALLGNTPPSDYERTLQEAKLSRQEYIRSAIQTRRATIEEAEREIVHKAAGPMTERLRKALQTSVKVDYKDVPLPELLKDLTMKAPGLSIRCSPRTKYGRVSLHFEEPLPVSAILQALEDDFNQRFIVRDYGILVPDPQVAVPPGAMAIDEFLRQKPAQQPSNQPAGAKNPPAADVEGRVKAVDASGLMTITLGSDAGLAKGHTLELFRLDKEVSESKCLGTVRIVEVEAHQSVAQPVGPLAAAPQSGDRVASRLSK